MTPTEDANKRVLVEDPDLSLVLETRAQDNFAF